MLLSAVAMLMFTGVSADSSYAADVLPGLLVIGLGLGLIFAPAMSTATLGVDRADAGVASALVNTGQQIGGSIGTALLSTLAAGAASSYAAGGRQSAQLLEQAAVHGYTTAFTWAAAIFAIGGLIAWALLSAARRSSTRTPPRSRVRPLRQPAARRARPAARPSATQ